MKRRPLVKITEFKVVERLTVTDDILEEVLNEWSRQGWVFDSFNFVPNEGSKRPKMAFIVFTREVEVPADQELA